MHFLVKAVCRANLHDQFSTISGLVEAYSSASTSHLPPPKFLDEVNSECRGRGAPKPPLKELGPDPSSGKPLVVKDGRFGPYVTDGETNASLRRGEDVDGLTLERALELLAERRAKGPAQPRRRTRSRR